MIKTVIFDLGNVLVHFSHNQMILQLSELLDLPYQTIKNKMIEDQLIHLYEAGALSTDALIDTLTHLSARSPSRNEFLHAMSEIFVENQQLTPLVHSLKRQGKKLILLSNTSEAHYQHIRRSFPFTELFDQAILSYEVKHTKPDPAIFHAALKASAALPHECFYVDDILLHVEAARRIGIDAELYESPEKLRHDLAKRMIFI